MGVVGQKFENDSSKVREAEDWDYLKKTLTAEAAAGLAQQSKELINFHEKVDALMSQQDDLVNKHMRFLRDSARFLDLESKLVTDVQGDVEYDVEEYVKKMERIIAKKLDMYRDMKLRFNKFKRNLKEEEEASHRVTGGFIY